MKRTVHSHLVDRIAYAVAKANVRAAKIGVAPFVLDVSGPRYVQRRNSAGGLITGEYDELVDVTIVGDVIRVAGWSLLGRVDIEPEGNLVLSRPGAELPARYRSAAGDCEHCRVKRSRKSVFVFEGDAGHIQVGRTCLQDFLGIDPDVVLHSVNAWDRLVADLDDIEAASERDQVGGGRRLHAETKTVLEMTAACIRAFGWVSVSAASDRGINSTASDVAELLFGKASATRVRVEQADVDLAAAVMAWVASDVATKSPQSDYEHNLAELVGREYIEVRRFGLVCSAVNAYQRATEERIKQASLVNAHIGAVKQRRQFEAVFAGESGYDTQFGWVSIGRFETAEGLVVYKGTSPFWDSSLAQGSKVAFVATIKEHGDYKGRLQTFVARAKMVMPVAEAA